MKRIIIQVVVLGFLFIGFSAHNGTFNILRWDGDTIIGYTVLSIATILAPEVIDYLNECN